MTTTAGGSQRGNPSSFVLDGGPVGVLMVHGLTGSPPELRPVANELHRRGLTVHAPLLPGHGTTPDDLNRRKRSEWIACVAGAYGMLRERCETVFVAGLSLGSLLTLHFAAGHPGLPGIILYAVPLGITDRREKWVPVMRFFVKSVRKAPSHTPDPLEAAEIWDYPVFPLHASYEALRLVEEVKQVISRITCPALIVHSSGDDFVRAGGPHEALNALGSMDKTLVVVHHCGHVLTAGAGAAEIAEKSYAFIAAHSGLGDARDRSQTCAGGLTPGSAR